MGAQLKKKDTTKVVSFFLENRNTIDASNPFAQIKD